MIDEATRAELAEQGRESLREKRVLITGGTKGIGRAVALLAARAGAKVFIFGRHEDNLEEALDELRRESPNVYGSTGDQANWEDLDRVFSEADAKLGGLDVLVNNAALAADSVVETEGSQWRYVVEANLLGYMRCVELATPRLRASGGGCIVNVGSMSAKLREEGSDVYVATKSGIRGFSDSLGKKLAEQNIRVTLIEPGLIATEMTEQSPEQMRERIAKMEMALTEDVAGCVLFVLSQPPRVCIPMLQVRPVMQKV